MIQSRLGKYGLLAISMLCVGCATVPMTTVHQHPELDQKTERIKTVAVMPVEVGLIRKTMSGDELWPEREQQLVRDFSRVIEEALKAKGYVVVEIAGSADPMNPSDENIRQLRSEIAGLSGQIDHAIPEAERASLRATLGATAGVVSKKCKADALLYVQFRGHEISGGRHFTESFLTSLANGGHGSGNIPKSEGGGTAVFVHGNGEVLWANHLTGRLDRNRASGWQPAYRRAYYGASDLMRNILAPLPARPEPPVSASQTTQTGAMQ